MKILLLLLFLYPITFAQNNEKLLFESARQGNQDDLETVLDILLFRANSLKRADPKLALEIYNDAKKVNPEIEIYGESILEMCAEPNDFDVENFLIKYGITGKEYYSKRYGIWQLAEEASRGGRFSWVSRSHRDTKSAQPPGK